MRSVFIIFLLLMISQVGLAKLPKSDWEVQSGELKYHVSFPLKKAEGVSKNVKGKGHCEKSKCEFLIASPLKSFDSGDGNRDNHMLEVTKAAKNPMVVVKVSFAEDSSTEKVLASADVQMSGQSKTYANIPVEVKWTGTEAKTTGSVPLQLSDLGIERPTLLGVAIDNSAPVSFELIWK